RLADRETFGARLQYLPTVLQPRTKLDRSSRGSANGSAPRSSPLVVAHLGPSRPGGPVIRSADTRPAKGEEIRANPESSPAQRPHAKGLRPIGKAKVRGRRLRQALPIERHPDARQIPGLVLFRWDAPLFFANAELFKERVLE